MAKVSGIAIRPGVSRNKRVYKRDVLAKAAVRLQKRLADEGAWPVNMYTSHERAAADDPTAIGGQVRKVWLTEDGAIAYEGVTPDSEAGDHVAKLATPDADGHKFLRHVSVRAFFLGPVEKDEDGNDVPSDMEIVGLDFTGRPGMDGTSVTAENAAGASRTEMAERTAFICESAEEASYMPETTTTEANKQPYGDVAYADPGYQSDKKKRYPIDTAAHVRAAWAYINKAKNGAAYTGAQLKRIKGRIKAAAKKFGIDIAGAGESADLFGLAVEALVEEASAHIHLDNGSWTDGHSVSVQGSTSDPAQHKALAMKIASAAVAALGALDPDNDGDIDDLDDDDESTTEPQVPEGAGSAPAERKEATVPTDNNQSGSATENAGTITLSKEELSAILAENTKQVIESVKAAFAPATESKAPEAAPETPEQHDERIRKEAYDQAKADLLNEQRKTGTAPERKGLVRDADGKVESVDLGAFSEADKQELFTGALLERFADMNPAFRLALQDAAS